MEKAPLFTCPAISYRRSVVVSLKSSCLLYTSAVGVTGERTGHGDTGERKNFGVGAGKLSILLTGDVEPFLYLIGE